MTAAFERFRGKRGLVMGLGLFGGGTEAAKFLARYCDRVLVTDLRSEEVLADSIRELEGLPIEYRLGEHRRQDFEHAEVVIHSPAVRPDNPLLQAARAHGAEVTMEMSLFIEACPATTVGITGSNGKTTTALLAYEMLCEVMQRAQPELEGKWAEPVGATLASPARAGKVWLGGNCGEPLINYVERMEGNDIVVLELSSFQLQDWHRIRCSCDIAVITNITANHLDWHRDMEEYIWAKKAVYEHQGDDRYAIFNTNDKVTAALLSDLKNDLNAAGPESESERYAYGYRGAVKNGDDKDLIVDGSSGTMRFPIGFGPVLRSEESVDVPRRSLRLPGEFNWENACAAGAAYAACLPGSGTVSLKRAIERFRGVEHRLEYCGEVNGARCFNDSIATTPESTIAGLSAFESGVHLLLGGSDKGLGFDALAAAIAAHPGIKGVYVQGANANTIETALARTGMSAPLIRCATFDEACKAVFAALQPGDVFLMSPASASFYEYAPNKRFTNFEHRGRHFKLLVQAHASKTS